jgi:capsular exopolysaccharide synthesis family protein
MITSPGPQEGKTLTLCNLAIAMAQNNKSVLIVDADMRKPRLHEVFGIDNSKGLSSFLSGQASFDDVTRKVNISNINLITGGIMPPNPSELLASHKLVDLIDKAKAKFDCVFIDSPPVGMLTDAVLASRAADGTIVTIESGKTSKRALGRIYQMIGQTHMHVVGVVLNKMPHTPGNGYYSYYYGNK